MTQEQAKAVYERFRQDDLSAADAAAQLVELLQLGGGAAESELDPKLSALWDELQPMTTLPCVVTATAATSCSRWCS